jgi:VWFA-related protein
VESYSFRRKFLFSLASLFPAGSWPRGDDQPTLSTGVNVVNVLATVRNKQKEIIHNLGKDDFRLEEDGHAQTIRYFARESELPLTLGLLVDTSMSQRGVLARRRTSSQVSIS